MIEGPLFLDVNIPMYAAGAKHPYREACQWVMATIAQGKLSAVIDAEIVQEILYRYGALERHALAVTLATNVLTIVPEVLPITRRDVALAIELFSSYAPQGIKARDLIHAAVMRNNGLTAIISTDTHFDHIEGISRLDPRQLYVQNR